MDKAKEVGNSSSFTMDLFGPKDSLKSSSASSGLLDSIFGPPTKVPGRDTPRFDSGRAFLGDAHKDHTTVEKGNGAMKKDRNSSYENRTAEPCYYNSSIYYGGQEVYSPPTQNISTHHVFKKDGGHVDQNEGNSSCASIGNWWQGSLYY